jgi:adenylate cyclase
MADIFISYSSKDRAQAEQLTEILSSAGLSVWIDKHGIDVATSWSEEIVNAIDSCKAFVLILSSSSVISHNVIKEVSLASEKKKKILPLDLEPVEIPAALQYALAGIQRSPMTSTDAIIRSLERIGLDANTVHAVPKAARASDGRRALMILPFDDLSPTQDNGWFADGIVNELITALSCVHSLRVADQQATKDYKRYTGTLPVYAREMGIRYFVQGDVRKFGDNIKITARLLDIQTGDHLWQDSMKGIMDDIFDIQEKVAEKVVEGLKVHLTSEEKEKLSKRGTENAEAYELYIKAAEYFHLQTKEGCRLAHELLSEAIRLDENYSNAYLFKATVLAELYRKYDTDKTLLDEAEALAKRSFVLQPDKYVSFYPLSQIYMHQGKHPEAEAAAKKLIEKEPANSTGYFALAFFYANIGRIQESIPLYEEAARIEPEKFSTMINLAAAYDELHDHERSSHWATQALPYIERHLKLHPNDQHRRVQHAIMLTMAGRTEEARRALSLLENISDGVTLYNAACLLAKLGDAQGGLEMLDRVIDAGFKVKRELNSFLNDEDMKALSDTELYKAIQKKLTTND